MFGLAMYEFIHTKKLWFGKKTDEAATQTLSGIRPELNITGPFADIINQCWHQELEKRPTFTELSKLLFNAYELK